MAADPAPPQSPVSAYHKTEMTMPKIDILARFTTAKRLPGAKILQYGAAVGIADVGKAKEK